MRSVIWLVLLFTAAVVAATALGPNDALVSMFYGSSRLDMSLNLFLIGLLATVFVLVAAMQAINALISLPVRAREWREFKRERAAQAALQEALAEFYAARYARAQRAAHRALTLQREVPHLRADKQFAVLAYLVAGDSLHRLQDRAARDERARAALKLSGHGAAAESARLLMAEWAVEDRDGERSLSLLADLAPGAARRTQALRLKLQAARLLRRPMDALQTARLLAKHQGFSSAAAQSLLRSLAVEALDQAHDEEQLRRVWNSFDTDDRLDAWVLARGARQAAALGLPEVGRIWLQPAWDGFSRYDADERLQLALGLIDCMAGIASDWLPRIEAAMKQHGHEAAVEAAAGITYAERKLWGKARGPLAHTASAEQLPTRVRRNALRLLALISREEGHDERATRYEQVAAGLD